MSGESEQFKKGLAVRRDVLGKDYVDGSIAKADDFMMAFQNITTEWCWGYAWTRPGLDRKTRSMLNLAMLTALKAPNELKLHVKGALTNGDLIGYADSIGLDTDKFAADLRKHVGAYRIAEDIDSADLATVSGTPTFFINGNRYYGAFDLSALKEAVHTAKARAVVGAQ